MSEQDEPSTEYRIDLTDIRGVGPATVRKLEDAGINHVEELHLFRTRVGAAWRQLEDAGVGRDTLGHLQAVGKAVKGYGSANVEAKHLTGPLADDAEFPSSFVRIDVPDETDGEDGDDGEAGGVSVPSEDELADALAAIHDEYDDDSYGEWVRFSGGITDHAIDEGFDVGTDFYQPPIQHAVVRFRFDADRLLDHDEFDDEHLAALASFGRSL